MPNDPAQPSQLQPQPPRPEVVRNTVRALAQQTADIQRRKHALETMVKRDITDQMALDVMRKGYMKGGVEAGKDPGEWVIKLAEQMKSGREVGVVVSVVG